jgi:hypothetical protein
MNKSELYHRVEKELEALKSFGIIYKNISINNNFLYVGNPYITQEFLDSNKIENIPFIISSHMNPNRALNLSENFRFLQIDREALKASAMEHFNPNIPNNIEYIVEYNYQVALKHKKTKEKELSYSFLQKINARYQHLLEAINNFNLGVNHGNR